MNNITIFFQFQITGTVQGVGFRPYILREARKAGLRGFVQNTGEGVLIVADNKKKVLAILEKVPRLARIEQVKIKNYKLRIRIREFGIRASDGEEWNSCAKNPSALAATRKILLTGRAAHLIKGSINGISPDVSICEECLEELFDPENRRHGYFHIGCTDCGPRFSLARGGVFDRENTALDNFPMCTGCRKEYENPDDRRFHMQGICCGECGPRVKWQIESGKSKVKSQRLKVKGQNREGLKIQNLKSKIQNYGKSDIIQEFTKCVNAGGIVLVKGVGGFSLVCNMEKGTVGKLRKLIYRKNKPLALMAKDLNMIKKFVHTSKKEEGVLISRERPITLLKKREWVGREQNHISENNRLGFVLPYTGLHYLLFEYLDEPIVFTSANLPHHPITLKNEEQFICSVVDYDREIINFSDDSIIKVIGDVPLLIRRSRGYVPVEIAIPSNYQSFKGDMLAVGAEFKNSFCLKKGDKILCSQELGNTAYLESFAKFQENLLDFLRFTGAEPEVVLCDGNPEFNVSKFVRAFSREKGIPFEEIQHHRAHVFSVALEHDLIDFIGIAADGTGWGKDGSVWGGEVFHNDVRIGHLEKQVLIGGDVANREPVRVLVGILSKFLSEEQIINMTKKFDQELITSLLRQYEAGFNCIESSSCGRVLDAVAVFLGGYKENEYEGRCVQMLESLGIKNQESRIKKIEIIKKNKICEINTTFIFQWLMENINILSKEELAYQAQLYLANGFWEVVESFGKKLPVVWSGGCAYNEVMTTFMLSKGVMLNREVSCGDGGIGVGQVGYFLWKHRNK